MNDSGNVVGMSTLQVMLDRGQFGMLVTIGLVTLSQGLLGSGQRSMQHLAWHSLACAWHAAGSVSLRGTA